MTAGGPRGARERTPSGPTVSEFFFCVFPAEQSLRKAAKLNLVFLQADRNQTAVPPPTPTASLLLGILGVQGCRGGDTRRERKDAGAEGDSNRE